MHTKTINKALAGALALALSSAAFAVPVTQLIHFDDASNGYKWYSTSDNNFLFAPTNFQSGNCADSTTASPSSCLIESNNGDLPRMIRPTDYTGAQGGNANSTPDFMPLTKGLFTLDSFYFELTGNGEGSQNGISVAGSNGASASFSLAAITGTGVSVSHYDPSEGGTTTSLSKDTGYIASLGSLFADVEWIQFSAFDSAQVRLDCIVASFDGSIEDIDEGNRFDPDTTCGIGGGDEPPVTVPEPGVLALLATGLLGMFSSRRRAAV